MRWTGRTRPSPTSCTTAATGTSRIAQQTTPMSSQRVDQGPIIGREGLLRLVEVVERLRARECGRDVSSWTREEAAAPDPGAGDGSAVGGPAGGQSAGGGGLARGGGGRGGGGGGGGWGAGGRREGGGGGGGAVWAGGAGGGGRWRGETGPAGG